jgi:hypothetical protein
VRRETSGAPRDGWPVAITCWNQSRSVAEAPPFWLPGTAVVRMRPVTSTMPMLSNWGVSASTCASRGWSRSGVSSTTARRVASAAASRRVARSAAWTCWLTNCAARSAAASSLVKICARSASRLLCAARRPMQPPASSAASDTTRTKRGARPHHCGLVVRLARLRVLTQSLPCCALSHSWPPDRLAPAAPPPPGRAAARPA